MQAISKSARRHERRQALRQKVAKRTKFVCFYTGLTQSMKPDLYYGHSIEHLLPKALMHQLPNGRKKNKLNALHRVPAIAIINQIIGHAPLKVKFELKEHLHSFPMFPKMDIKKKIDAYVLITKAFMSKYKAKDSKGNTIPHLPWYWESIEDPEHKEVLRREYFKMLTPEELALAIARAQKRKAF